MIDILIEMVVACAREVLVGIAGRHVEEALLKLLKRATRRHPKEKRRTKKQPPEAEISTWGKK